MTGLHMVEGYDLAGSGFDGRYLDNTDVYRAMRRVLDAEEHSDQSRVRQGKKK
ncbi:MAG: hypothetical protein WCP20_21305 [Desulfuromonadales bacterium]